MKDIRLHISFPNHRKTKRLIKALGEEAPLCLVRLWCFAAQHRTNGLLNNLTNEDITEEAGYTGQAEDFIQTLLDIGWLDDTSKGLELHDWSTHQPYIATHKKRSEQASEAAKIRWEKEKKKQEVACGSHESALRSDEKRYAPYPFPFPSPYPFPLPKTTSKEIETCLRLLSEVKGYPLGKKDVAFLEKLTEEFPGFDPVCVVRGWAAYLLDVPLQENSKPRAQLRNQFEMKKKYGRCKRGSEETIEDGPVVRETFGLELK